MTETALKFQRELRSFHALATVSIVFGAIAMILAISHGVQNMLTLVKAQSTMLPQIILSTLRLMS